MKYLKFFREIKQDDLYLVGGKALSLGKLASFGFGTPSGFVITTDAFKDFNEKEIPSMVQEEIFKAFDSLKVKRVAVRSSAVGEDSENLSWAGQLETYLNVDRENVILNIKKCWESIQSQRAKAYIRKNKLKKEQAIVAVIIQEMINSEISGVIFTENPTNIGANELVIESGYGLGELVVQGEIVPDRLILDKKSLVIKKRIPGNQDKKLIFLNGKNTMVKISGHQGLTLNDQEAIDLGKIGLGIEKEFGFPSDIEWAKEGGMFFILQARPITTISTSIKKGRTGTIQKSILEGIPASQGIVTGRVRIITDEKDISKLENGEILVTEKTTPDFIEGFNKMVGVVTDLGGITSHAAIVARELGVPAVVATIKGTKILKDGEEITIDGTTGKIYEGKLNIKIDKSTKGKSYGTESSGDDITDMVNSMVASAIDARELWPLSPIQLFSYIDFDQAYDVYLKLKASFGKGEGYEDIAKLFRYPTALKFFMMNSGATGLKVGAALKLAPVTIQDNIKFFEWLIAILKKIMQEDPFSLRGRNIVWDEEKVNKFLNENDWIGLSDNTRLKNAINLLSVNLFTLNWSFYTDYFGANGSERHGPYPIPKGEFGQSPKLLVRDFFDLKPDEIWPIAKKVPFRSITLAQIYDETEIYLNFGNTIVNQESITKFNNFFALLVDGRPVSKLEEIEKLSDIISALAKEQIEDVNSLSDLDKVRKCAMVAYYGLKNFYLHFGNEWFPKEKLESTIKILGMKPFEQRVDNRDEVAKKKVFDPRIEWTP